MLLSERKACALLLIAKLRLPLASKRKKSSGCDCAVGCRRSAGPKLNPNAEGVGRLDEHRIRAGDRIVDACSVLGKPGESDRVVGAGQKRGVEIHIGIGAKRGAAPSQSSAFLN